MLWGVIDLAFPYPIVVTQSVLVPDDSFVPPFHDIASNMSITSTTMIYPLCMGDI